MELDNICIRMQLQLTITHIIMWQHRMHTAQHTATDTAYCYRWSGVVCPCLCWSLLN